MHFVFEFIKFGTSETNHLPSNIRFKSLPPDGRRCLVRIYSKVNVYVFPHKFYEIRIL